MPVALCRRVANVFALLPLHRLSAPDHEVLALVLFDFVRVSIARAVGPAAEEDDVAARNVETVAVPRIGWGSRDAEAGPNERLSVEHTDVIQVRGVAGCSLVQTASFQLLFLQSEAAVNDQVVANQNGAVALAGGGLGATCLGATPGHDFEIQNVYVVVVVLSVPATKHEHLRAVHKSS